MGSSPFRSQSILEEGEVKGREGGRLWFHEIPEYTRVADKRPLYTEEEEGRGTDTDPSWKALSVLQLEASIGRRVAW